MELFTALTMCAMDALINPHLRMEPQKCAPVQLAMFVVCKD